MYAAELTALDIGAWVSIGTSVNGRYKGTSGRIKELRFTETSVYIKCDRVSKYSFMNHTKEAIDEIVKNYPESYARNGVKFPITAKLLEYEPAREE